MKLSVCCIISSIIILAAGTALAQEWTQHTIVNDFTEAADVTTADMDGDGDLDVIGAAGNANVDNVIWWENLDGGGNAWTAHVIDTDAPQIKAVHAADMDGDGDQDVLIAVFETHDLVWWENLDGLGTSWEHHFVDDYVHGIHDGIPVDMDQDGDMDVVAAAYWGEYVSWYDNLNGDGESWQEYPIVGFTSTSRPTSVFAADMNNDGALDVCVSLFTAGEVIWCENDGDNLNWTAHTVSDAVPSSNNLCAADFDGDGDADIAGAVGGGTDAVFWWENVDGLGTSWTQAVVADGFDGAEDIASADVDGDGDTDLIACAQNWGSEIAWWENTDGTGGTWTMQSLGAVNQASSVHTADVNNDGALDILGTSKGDHSVFWWEQITDPQITVLNPAGGETWQRGETYTVQWADNIPDNVQIYLIQGGQLVEVIAANTPSDGSYDWTIPWDGDYGSGYRVYIRSAVDTDLFDTSDPFVLEQPWADIILTPHDAPVTVPQGGMFSYDLAMDMTVPSMQTGVIWTEAVLPNGATFGPVFEVSFAFAPGMAINVTNILQAIPASAPLGDFEWVLNAGPNTNTPMATASFPFTVTAANLSLIEAGNAWTSRGQERILAAATPAETEREAVASQFRLDAVYPNPFNPSTTVSLTLPRAAGLTVAVYNVAGQQVATLADGRFAAGQHQFTFDARDLASGVYLLRATVPGELSETRKLLLVR